MKARLLKKARRRFKIEKITGASSRTKNEVIRSFFFRLERPEFYIVYDTSKPFWAGSQCTTIKRTANNIWLKMVVREYRDRFKDRTKRKTI